MEKTPKYIKIVSVKIDPETYEKLEKIREKLGHKKLSPVIRLALQLLIEKLGETQ